MWRNIAQIKFLLTLPIKISERNVYVSRTQVIIKLFPDDVSSLQATLKYSQYVVPQKLDFS